MMEIRVIQISRYALRLIGPWQFTKNMDRPFLAGDLFTDIELLPAFRELGFTTKNSMPMKSWGRFMSWMRWS